MGSEQYGLSNSGFSGYMRSGVCAYGLLCQVGKYYVPALSSIGLSGLMRSNQTAAASAYRQIADLEITETSRTEPPECAFSLHVTSAGLVPHCGDPVVVAVGSLQSPIFTGCLTAIEITQAAPNRWTYQCTATGLARDLEKRIIAGTWTGTAAGDILQELLHTYTPHLDSVANVESGVILADFQADDEALLDVCQRLADLCGYIFAVAPDRQVHFHRPEFVDAPWDLDAVEHFGDLTISDDSGSLRTCVIVRYSALTVKSQSFTGDGDTKDFQLDYVPHAITSLAVNGAALDPEDYGVHYAEDNEDKQFSIDYGRGIINTRAHAVLGIGDTLACAYTAKIPARLIRHHRAAQLARQAAEGGDGLYDYVITDRDILSRSAARAAADAQLEQYAYPLTTARYTRVEDLFGVIARRLQPGQQQALALWGRTDTLTITTVRYAVQCPTDANALRWAVTVELGPAAPRLDAALAADRRSAELETDELIEEEDYE